MTPATAALLKSIAKNAAETGHPNPCRGVILERISTLLRNAPDLVAQKPELGALLKELDEMDSPLA
ncbi:MAG TPA: hypothetical protein V6C65_10580 [Allocoleopsis sp.]